MRSVGAISLSLAWILVLPLLSLGSDGQKPAEVVEKPKPGKPGESAKEDKPGKDEKKERLNRRAARRQPAGVHKHRRADAAPLA